MELILGIAGYCLLGAGIIQYQARILNQKQRNVENVVYTSHQFEKKILFEVERQEKMHVR